MENEFAAKKKEIQDFRGNTSITKKGLEDSIKSLTSSESDLKIKLSKANTRISEIESNLKALTEKNSELENTLLNRNKVIEKIEDDFEKRISEIEGLKKEIEKLNDELNKSVAAPKLVKKIQEIMLHKGFLSDKEFYQMINEIETELGQINF
jgi:chromosome segregation ATPase